jgi:uncharacterized PurR-regulated membrane protein YhhQ (DUF165 family)
VQLWDLKVFWLIRKLPGFRLAKKKTMQHMRTESNILGDVHDTGNFLWIARYYWWSSTAFCAC